MAGMTRGCRRSAGLRRRGVTASVLAELCYHIGITKYDGLTDVAVLEHAIREEFNRHSPRRLAGTGGPLKRGADQLPRGEVEELEAVNNSEEPETGKRKLPFWPGACISSGRISWRCRRQSTVRLRPGGEVAAESMGTLSDVMR